MKRFLLAQLSILVGLFVVAVVMEYMGGLSLYQHIRYAAQTPEQARISYINDQYKPFMEQELNPFTIFSIPNVSNETVHMHNGFRGPGPEERGNKKLAFLLGGSTAFSNFSSSDDTTITAYLNKIQDKYFFVTAGVPSFGTTQELARLIHEILPFDKPALVISFAGVNDVAHGTFYAHTKYPIGTPESFSDLEKVVEDNKKGGGRLPQWTLFPQLSRHAKSIYWKFFPRNVVQQLSDEEKPVVAKKIADKYLINTRMMKTLTESFGGKFLNVLQPIREPDEIYSLMRSYISSDTLDLTTIPSELFWDRVHLTDAGNEYVARKILNAIQ